MKGVFIELKDIQAIHGIGKSAASEQFQLLKAIYERPKINVAEYCEYWGITIEMFLDVINKKRNDAINQSAR